MEIIMANRINLNQTSYHGAGAIEEIANEAKAHGFKKAFVCSDPDLVKFHVTSKVTDILEKNGLAYELYSDIKPNPTIENVQHGVQAFKNSGADYLIAIGGGSSMDTSKAIGIIIANPEFEDVRSLEGTAPTKKPCVPIIAFFRTSLCASSISVRGALRVPTSFPIMLRAALTGIGFTSQKSASISGSASNCILRLPAISPEKNL